MLSANCFFPHEAPLATVFSRHRGHSLLPGIALSKVRAEGRLLTDTLRLIANSCKIKPHLSCDLDMNRSVALGIFLPVSTRAFGVRTNSRENRRKVMWSGWSDPRSYSAALNRLRSTEIHILFRILASRPSRS